jgi:bacterioferritin-associated ferredoxin
MSQKNKSGDRRDPLICLCNSVRKSKIIDAIKSGATTKDEIFDQTLAGVGACGGSCRPQLQELLDSENIKKKPTDT